MITRDDIQNIEIGGVDSTDYPDYCNAFIEYAEYLDGTELTDDDYEEINFNSDLVYKEVLAYLF